MANRKQLAIWEAAWADALALWSNHLQLSMPLWCFSLAEAHAQGLTQSFAAIRLNTQQVMVNLKQAQRLELDELALEVLAHEIGHHVYAPANMTRHLQMLAITRRSLPTAEALAPLVANLYTDLLINQHLQRQHNCRMDEVYRRLRSPSSSLVWRLYMRIYERLWQQPSGSLGGHDLDESQQGDAWLGARIIKVYGKDWLTGASRFAMLLLPYLLEEKEDLSATFGLLMDTEHAGRGYNGGGALDLPDITVIHPSLDELLGANLGSRPPQENPGEPRESDRTGSKSQAVEPQEFYEVMRAAGLDLSRHDIAVRFYREHVRTLPLSYPDKPTANAVEPEFEGYDIWQLGDDPSQIDWLASAMFSREPIPGITTRMKVFSEPSGQDPARQPFDLDLYVDCSGSMPNPQLQLSYPTLAGALLCHAAIKAGASVQVTLWSGARQCITTEGFIQDETATLRVLTGYLGGGTSFPLHILRETYREPRARPTHIVILSDDGVTTLFNKDDQGREGRDISAEALKNAGGGGYWVLDLYFDPDQPAPSKWQQKTLNELNEGREQGWQLHRVQGLEQLLGFAQAFSRQHYR
ncbi:MAG: DUF58 domain-containing protein [Marinobacter sp.]|nr:DUF58 domain-containing protein [Marinobacter sp.]